MSKHKHVATNFWQDYRPLIIIVGFCFFMTLAQNYPYSLTSDSLVYGFMAYFFIFLTLFKMFDLSGFVEGFATYDLITARLPVYGYCYPFIELGLGLAYLAQFDLYWLNIVTLIVMMISGLGVLKSMLSGARVKCACLGTVLNVPLSSISLLENFGMGLMAAWQLIIANIYSF